jgi:hypothetical protein
MHNSTRPTKIPSFLNDVEIGDAFIQQSLGLEQSTESSSHDHTLAGFGHRRALQFFFSA